MDFKISSVHYTRLELCGWIATTSRYLLPDGDFVFSYS
jgi:hypothetical protein